MILVFCFLFSFDFAAYSIYAYDDPGIYRALLYMTVTAIVFFILILIIESRAVCKLMNLIQIVLKGPKPKSKRPHLCDGCIIERDVKNEKYKVNDMKEVDMKSHNLVLDNLAKYYGKFMAVRGICLVVER